MVDKQVLIGLGVAAGAVGTLLIGRALLKSGCPRANSDNAVELATMIANGSFPGTVPDFFRDFTTFEFLQGSITQTVWIDAYNFLVNEGIITCG